MATAKINFYERYAVEHMVIDETEDGQLFCKVCSERHEHVSYTVRVDESGLVPVATSCNCASVKPCKHMNIVNAFYARIYASNVAKAERKATEQVVSPVVEAEKAIREAERRIEAGKVIDFEALDTEKDIRRKSLLDAPLNGNRAFSILKVS